MIHLIEYLKYLDIPIQTKGYSLGDEFFAKQTFGLCSKGI